MKRRVFSLFMITVIILVSIANGFSATAEEENLIQNGDFTKISSTLPTNWNATLRNNTTAEVVKNVSVATGVNVNAIKFTTTATSSTKNELYYTGKVKIEKNTAYTTTFWVKSSTISGLRTCMYEPTYIDASGVEQTSPIAREGQNIYTYSHKYSGTRVIRTDINHNWKIKKTGTVIDPSATASMFIFRSNNVSKLPAEDYPNETKAGEWVQIEHTFETGNDASHEAEISYSFAFPSVENGDFWIANVVMTAQKKSVDATFTPTINDPALGAVSPSGTIELVKNTPTTLTAEPFGENTFEGWYSNGVCVTTNPELTFTYDGENLPQYEAKFTKANWGIDGSYENSTPQKVANVAFSSTSEWTEDTFKSSSIDGIHYADSAYGGTYRTATISKSTPHTGEYSLECSMPYGYYGRKFTGLNKNSNYKITFYAYTPTSSGTANTSNITITGADYSVIKKATSGSLANKKAEDVGVLYYNSTSYNTLNNWTKITAEFNTCDNTEVILWTFFLSSSGKQFLDNFSISREANEYTPTINNPDLGFVNSVSVKDGEQATLVATCYGETVFEGWYNNDTCVSTANEFTFTYDANNPPNYEARFTKSDFGVFDSYEKGYTSGQILAVPGVTNSEPWTEDAFIKASNDNLHFIEYNGTNVSWMNATVSNEEAHSGNQSLSLKIRAGYAARKFDGLSENTDYLVEFYLKTTNAHDTLENFKVTPAGTSVFTLSDYSDYRIVNNTEGIIQSGNVNIKATTEWQKVSIVFNSQNNKEILLWLYMYGSSPYTYYIDDVSISRATKLNVTDSRLGLVSVYCDEIVAKNSTVTLTAIPYEGNTFEGWYVNDQLLSTETEYTIRVTEDINLTPKFHGNNMPSYNHFEHIKQDGTFENGTINGWRFYDPKFSTEWCQAQNSTDQAYEGKYSLMLYSRYRDTLLPLKNLFENTNYTLSFYLKFDATDDAANIDYLAIIPSKYNDLESTNEVLTVNTTVTPGAEWQKVELSFNSKNHTELNFAMSYTTDGLNRNLYIDNMILEVGEYTGTSFTPGNINGDEDNCVDLSDLVALAQYVAGWENLALDTRALDVDGNSLVNLEDIVHLARYLADWEDITLSQVPYYYSYGE